mgnify:FL=1
MEPNFFLKIGQDVQVRGHDDRLTWAQVVGLDGYWVTVKWLTPRIGQDGWLVANTGETHRTRLVNIVA